MWGHDFRPDYLAIPKALPDLGDPPVLGITATATPAMGNQIAAGLGRDLARVKISLFIYTACAATLLATIQVMEAGSADTTRGLLKEFEAIIAAVIGGVLLTGGYGTVYGVLFGALIFGFVQMGIFYTGIDTDWFKVFLGLMILTAVLINNYIRIKALGRGGER